MTSDDLALVRAALPPGQSPEARLADIRRLANEVARVDAVPYRTRAPAVEPKAEAVKARGAPARNHDARLRAAYRRAAAAGVSPSVLGREQRQFRRAVQGVAGDRAAVARLYERRIRNLDAQARRARG